MLHADEVAFRHPVTGEPLTVRCPAPPGVLRQLTPEGSRDSISRRRSRSPGSSPAYFWYSSRSSGETNRFPRGFRVVDRLVSIRPMNCSFAAIFARNCSAWDSMESCDEGAGRVRRRSPPRGATEPRGRSPGSRTADGRKARFAGSGRRLQEIPDPSTVLLRDRGRVVREVEDARLVFPAVDVREGRGGQREKEKGYRCGIKEVSGRKNIRSFHGTDSTIGFSGKAMEGVALTFRAGVFLRKYLYGIRYCQRCIFTKRWFEIPPPIVLLYWTFFREPLCRCFGSTTYTSPSAG